MGKLAVIGSSILILSAVGTAATASVSKFDEEIAKAVGFEKKYEEFGKTKIAKKRFEIVTRVLNIDPATVEDYSYKGNAKGELLKLTQTKDEKGQSQTKTTEQKYAEAYNAADHNTTNTKESQNTLQNDTVRQI